MSDQLFLIAHKVRGEPAFDVAVQQTCPECADGAKDIDGYLVDCTECNGEGHWWICSTSGHRARPYWHIELRNENGRIWFSNEWVSVDWPTPTMPEGWPDHYTATAIRSETLSNSKAHAARGKSILAALGLGKPKETLKRRL